MRLKTLLLIIGILLVIVFAALNVEEFVRPSTVNLGFTTMQLPLGLVMLMLVLAILLLFLITTLYMRSANLHETRGYAKQLVAQRELADKAEASRFTELHRYMQTQADTALVQSNNTIAAFNHRLAQTENLLLQRLEQTDNTNATYWGQQDDALRRSRPLNPL